MVIWPQEEKRDTNGCRMRTRSHPRISMLGDWDTCCTLLSPWANMMLHIVDAYEKWQLRLPPVTLTTGYARFLKSSHSSAALQSTSKFQVKLLTAFNVEVIITHSWTAQSTQTKIIFHSRWRLEFDNQLCCIYQQASSPRTQTWDS